MKNVLAIGISNKEFFNIILTYYPRENDETYSIVLFLDEHKVTVEEISDIINRHSIEAFKSAKIFYMKEILAHFDSKFPNLTTGDRNFLYAYNPNAKLILPIFLRDKFSTEKVYTLDDDVFIFKTLNSEFSHDYAFKKETMFRLRGSLANETTKVFNSIFGTTFTIDELNKISLNSGTIVYNITKDSNYDQYVLRFIQSAFIQRVFYDYSGFTSWTLEQRFQHFNMHRLQNEFGIDLLSAKEVNLTLGYDKHYRVDKKYLVNVTPNLIHYACGVKKNLFLSQFLSGIEWVNGFKYIPLYELKETLYDFSYQPPKFKTLYASTINKRLEKLEIKKNSQTTSLF